MEKKKRLKFENYKFIHCFFLLFFASGFSFDRYYIIIKHISFLNKFVIKLTHSYSINSSESATSVSECAMVRNDYGFI